MKSRKPPLLQAPRLKISLSPFTTSRTSENWTSINSVTSFSRTTLSPKPIWTKQIS
ncbi:hypothetical protein PO909_002906 [Leuciscus waleckii]